jgi:TATA-box binding protein (TBP) (component of TFIID and TFIIIB)
MANTIIRLFYTIVSIFPSGKLISVGTKSPEQAQQDMNNAVKILVSEYSIKPVNIKAELRNIVAVQNIGTTVRARCGILLKEDLITLFPLFFFSRA